MNLWKTPPTKHSFAFINRTDSLLVHTQSWATDNSPFLHFIFKTCERIQILISEGTNSDIVVPKYKEFSFRLYTLQIENEVCSDSSLIR